MSSICVTELMHPCVGATVQSQTCLREAARRVLATGMESLPVVDDEGRLTGLIAQAALIRELMCVTSQTATVAPIVSQQVDSARNTANLDSVLPLFRSAAVTMIPVVDEHDHPVGLVHRRDVIQYLLADGSADEADTAADAASRPHFLAPRTQSSDYPASGA